MCKKKMFTSFIVTFIAVFAVYISGCSQKKGSDVTRIAMGGSPPTTIDPTSFFANDNIVGNIFESLVCFDKEQQVSPKLAVSWHYLDDNKILRFELRENVYFSNGTLFTSEDVVFSLERNRETNMGIASQIGEDFIGVKAVDDYTVDFEFSKPNARFLYQTCALLYIVTEEDYEKLGEREFARNPVGTGPYVVKEWKEGQYIDFVRNEAYWGEKPNIEKARIVFSEDDHTRISMLKAGEVEVITNVPWNTVASLKQDGYNITKVPQALSIGISFDLIENNEPWADVRVRKAINYCIDKDGIIEKLCNNIPNKVDWMYSWEVGYQSELKSAYPYNLKKAKALMQEAGLADGFEMPIIYSASTTGLKTIVEYISYSLKEIGIECKLTALNHGPEFFGKIKKLREDPAENAVIIWEIGQPGNADPTVNLVNAFYSGTPSGLYHTPSLDLIIQESLETVENMHRKELIEKAYQIINEDLPVINILQSVHIIASQKKLTIEPSSAILSAHSTISEMTNEL